MSVNGDVKFDMIHELIVSIEEAPEKLRKRARKLAMTGGYEVTVSPDLEGSQLTELYELYRSELERYDKESAAYQASLAGRILKAISRHSSCSPLLAEKVDSCLSLES